MLKFLFVCLFLFALTIVSAKPTTATERATFAKNLLEIGKNSLKQERTGCSTGVNYNVDELVNQAINTIYFGTTADENGCMKFYFSAGYSESARAVAKQTLISYVGYAYLTLTISDECDGAGFYWGVCYMR